MAAAAPSVVLVRPLMETDAAAYRAFRLGALTSAPEAFSSSYEDEAQTTVDDFRRRLAPQPPNVIFGAFVAGALVGMAGFFRHAGTKRMHKGALWGVYVDRSQRGQGVAKTLVQHVIDHAAHHVTVLEAGVGVDNQPARNVYHGLGFRPYGMEKKALLVDGRYIDEELLALDFADGRAIA